MKRITRDEAKRLATVWHDEVCGKDAEEQDFMDKKWAQWIWKSIPRNLLIARAQDNRFAYESIGSFVLYLSRKKKPLPRDVAKFIAFALKNPEKAPSRKNSNPRPKRLYHDNAISGCVHMLKVIGDLDPVGHTSDANRDAGSFIVAEVWGMEFDTVRKKYGKMTEEHKQEIEDLLNDLGVQIFLNVQYIENHIPKQIAGISYSSFLKLKELKSNEILSRKKKITNILGAGFQ